jgi:Tol biopolymer transport system component
VRVLLTVAAAAASLAFPGVAAVPDDLIVFTRTVGDRQEVFSIRPDGSAPRRLTPRGRSEGDPALSPDRRLVAAAGDGAIGIRARTGQLVHRIRVLTGSELTHLSWSPGGRWVAFLAERCESDQGRDLGPLCADLWLVRPDGSARRRLVEADVSTSDPVASYDWSPNGRSIVFERYRTAGLAVVDVRTGATRTLRGTRRSGADPDWSPSGWIVFTRQRGPFKGADLYAVRPTGAGLHRLCRAANAVRPVSSRHGERIAFLDYRPASGLNRWHVRVVRSDGGPCRRVGTATEEWTLTWSPDGTRLLWENFNERLMIGRTDGRGRTTALTRGSSADWR